MVNDGFRRPMILILILILILMILLISPMLLNQTLQKQVRLLAKPLRPLLITSRNPIQDRHKILRIIRRAVLEDGAHNLPKLPGLLVRDVIPVVPLPRHHPHYDVESQLREHRLELHFPGALSRSERDSADQPPDLVSSDPPEEGEDGAVGLGEAVESSVDGVF
ncbi:hypothetical protein PanWU01x14_046260 [Parasponia andersonii]|uniref:Transmembrane protein n=1 Tax=Parasponia andersonii TaxID=3476 RepID=A0A2P5DNN2_PARAD|nr:hypothetical protein PanWU01x14_046260 [Parasponia andersonii]